MLALELFRSVPRYVAARAVGERVPGLLAGPLAPLRLVNRDEPILPGEGWARVRPRLSGICGSDLATISGRASFYFSSLVSMPLAARVCRARPADATGSPWAMSPLACRRDTAPTQAVDGAACWSPIALSCIRSRTR